MKKSVFTIRVIAFIFMAALFVAQDTAAQEKRPMSFTDVAGMKGVSDPKLSPDGRQILFTISEANWKENKKISHIWRVDTDGSGLARMTNGKDGESGGIWSPDGKYISFITKRGEESQIHLMRTDGGEAYGFTRHKGGVLYFQWSPDSRKIYFIASEPLSEAEKAKKTAQDDAYIFEENYKNLHLWVIDVPTEEETRLTQGDLSVSFFSLSRDGEKIVYRVAPTPLYDDSAEAEIWLMDLEDASTRRITRNNVSEGGISLSPDNKLIKFTADANQEFESYYETSLFIVPSEGGNPELLLPEFDREIWDSAWSADGRFIYFTANTGVRNEIFKVKIEDRKISQLTKGDHAIYRFDYVPELDMMAYFVNTSDNPAVLWISSMADFSPRIILDPYPELNHFRLARFEAVQWESTDGLLVEGILIYPLDYVEGQRYPLLAHTHGGPMASDKFSFDGFSHAQAGRGYAVLKPNYRGSTGYGSDYLRDMVGHYFLHADDDVLTGVDFLIDKGIADPDKLGTLGWSAGGHMTNWLVTQTDRFKAASSGAGASNWISMYAQSDVRIYRTPWFLDDPWQAGAPLEAYRDHSPIFQVHKVKTPTLILFGENDGRVPLPQGIEMYRGLKANGVPTELVIFPRAGHNPTELRHILYRMNKQFQWLEKYIRGRDFPFDEPPEEADKK